MENPQGAGTGAGGAASAPRKRGRGLLWSIIAVVLAFGAGFGWQYYEANLIRAELAETQQALSIERLRVRLGQAAIAAQSGDYESARRRMSDFFTRLDDAAPTLPDHIAGLAEDFLATRDEVITGLSRSNHEYADVLYGMLDRFREISGLDAGTTIVQPEEEEPAAEGDTGAEPDSPGG